MLASQKRREKDPEGSRKGWGGEFSKLRKIESNLFQAWVHTNARITNTQHFIAKKGRKILQNKDTPIKNVISQNLIINQYFLNA